MPSPHRGARRHIVLVSTLLSRSALLSRALATVRKQLLPADRVVVVMDDRDISPVEVEGVDSLRNRRTKGLAGALNSGLDHLLRTEDNPHDVWVSFLDDDDHWPIGYIAAVAEAATDGVDVLATGLQRLDAETLVGHPPPSINVADFLRGNPGIQGSNLTVRLSTILEAGLFDEALPSCTDRDLCIRLLDVGAGYRPVTSTFAVHDTLHDQPRLSDPGSVTKRDGLDAFFAKWRLRMTDDDRDAFTIRARRLFGWSAPPEDSVGASVGPSGHDAKDTRLLRLVCATIVDGSCPQRAMALMDDLARLNVRSQLDGLWVVLLENGDARGFSDVEQHARARGLRVYTVARQHHAALAEPLGINPTELHGRMSIAVARSLIQLCAGAFAEQLNQPVVWVLDDDARLPDDLDGLLAGINRVRDADIDVALAPMVGAPPVPHSYSLRVQCVDLLYTLHVAARHSPDDKLPSITHHNERWSRERRDYYNDLSRAETDRLETPFLPPMQAPTWRDLLAQLGQHLPAILRGEQVFRPVTATHEEAKPSVFRGGNTLVFRTQLLTSVPNLSPLLGGRRTRRSDMLWATVAMHKHDAKVCAVRDVAVRQDRTFDEVCAFDADRTVDDIVGYACARAADEALNAGSDMIDPRLCRKYAEERLASLALSVWRVIGAIRAIGHIVNDDTAWWSADPTLRGFVESVRGFHDVMTRSVTLAVLADVQNRVRTALESSLPLPAAFPSIADAAVNAARDWVSAARGAAAQAMVGREIEILGAGKEGVVLRDGDETTKVFDLWTRADQEQALPTLRTLIDDDLGGAIPKLLRVLVESSLIVAVFRFEETTPYVGGTAAPLHQLLSRLMQRGWAHQNLSPSNLRFTASGSLQLIDVGRSVRRATPDDHARMLRKAIVLWRFPQHPELLTLLTRSADPALPEAVGWRSALQVMTDQPPKAQLDRAVACFAAARAGHVLDVGCGKPGALARAVAPRPLLAYDVDDALRPRWVDQEHAYFCGTKHVEERVAAGDRWDTVVCSLVLCAVDDEAADEVVALVARAMAVGGRALIAVCDPTSVGVLHSTSQARTVCGDYRRHHSYKKWVGAAIRDEHHRPLAAYRRLFARHNLGIVREDSIDELDVDRFERVGAFVIFEVEKLPPTTQQTSLLITACALDAHTVDVQVRHLVTTLGRARAFDEVVVAVDENTGPFARAHTTPDQTHLDRALDELLHLGFIDRVYRLPAPSELAHTNRFWFGVTSTAARAQNGQPVSLFLSAFDACAHDLILHVDVDAMVARTDVDLIKAAITTFDSDERVVALSLPGRGASIEPTDATASGPHRVEVTGSWLHRARLRQLAPLPNEVERGRWRLPWHRSVDERVRRLALRSVRQGQGDTWYVTLDNARKINIDEHLLLIDRMESCIPPAHDLHRSTTTVLGPSEAWYGPKRDEALVVVCTGRNVSPGRVTRFFDALRAQTLKDFGVIVIDDASDNCCADVVQREVDALECCTYIRRRRRVGQVANIDLAVRHIMTSPDSIVVLADLDDALASSDGLRLIRAAHDDADVVVGNMLRTDKPGHVYSINFEAPRTKRGGNVWVHPRTFRRNLFLAIDESDLRDVSGMHFELASDWSFMVPIVELARRPKALSSPLMLHEPSAPRSADHRQLREAAIARIVAKPRYPHARTVAERAQAMPVFCYHRVLPRGDASLDAIYRMRGMVVDVDVFEAQLRLLRQRFDLLTLADFHEVIAGTRGLPRRAALVTFDDAYVDIIDHVLPLLERLGVPAVVFARSPQADGWPQWAPLDLLYAVLAKRGGAAPAELAELRKRTMAQSAPNQEAFVRDLARTLQVDVHSDERRALYVDDDGLRRLATVTGLSVGSHGTAHVRGDAVGTDVTTDYAEAIAWLDKVAPASARAMSYPDGDVSAAATADHVGFHLGFGLQVPWATVTRHRLRRAIVANSINAIDEIAQGWMSP